MTMNTKADLISDIVIPTTLILGLFILNGVIFAVIMRLRRRILDDPTDELNAIAGDSNAIELQHL